MSISIVTKANLGTRTNLKTAGITPIIKLFAEKGELVQVLCQIHSQFHFSNTSSCMPLWYRFILRLLRTFPWLPVRSLVIAFPDFLASIKLQRADVVFFHPAAQFPQTLAKAKKMGSVTLGIATVAHPLFEEELYRVEYERFGSKFSSGDHLKKLSVVVHELDYIIAYSDFVKLSYVANGYPADRVSVAYSDIPIPDVVPKRDFNKKFSVLFLAYATPRKGLQYLLEAWEEAQLSDAELVIVGGYGSDSYTPPEFKEYCDTIVKLNSSIVWVDNVSDTSSYYLNASLFVLPSLSEGNPKVVMEAMSYGLPVITTPNAQSLVEDDVSGYVVPIRDSSAIAKKLTFLFEHREIMREMGQAARIAMSHKKPFGETVYEIFDKL
jgi:glycosyltransferase involved in cell wall biosynthesis